MSFARIPKWAIRSGKIAEMNRSSLAVLIVLADCLESKADKGRVSVGRICERSGLKRRAVQIGLSDLTGMGIIERDSTTGEYRFLPESGGAPQCAGAHDDAQGSAPECADGRTTMRDDAHDDAQTVARNKDKPRTSYQELSLQEANPVRVSDGLIPYDGRRVEPSSVHKPLLDRLDWPQARRGNAQHLIAHALLELADGAEGDDAAQDPVGWLYARLKLTVDDAEDPRWVPKISKWFADHCPHLVFNAMPVGYGVRR